MARFRSDTGGARNLPAGKTDDIFLKSATEMPDFAFRQQRYRLVRVYLTGPKQGRRGCDRKLLQEQSGMPGARLIKPPGTTRDDIGG